eukprot:gnl/TRDRNA2_/TRDRNA2_65495_c0_seq1.p1 gnl/TRDRNA2_/TRDRNA2_65495_c0~~gnl/TRDRNA2_/TRDRNA2_65495_c0_seq1.p1  ORF type:complete len:220 (+),score=34.70 gnl/TRDRNA2_/TRDRNA2_65495_c0_seq1:93-752(+)
MKSVFSLILLGVLFASGEEDLGGDYRVKFEVMTPARMYIEHFTIAVHTKWAPNSAARFKELVKSGYYNDNRFFRVIPDFLLQFGMHGNNQRNMEQFHRGLPHDEPFSLRNLKAKSNVAGTVAFALQRAEQRGGRKKADTANSQVIIHFTDNSRLDDEGYVPFGEVEGDGMEVLKQLHNCGEKPDQLRIIEHGQKYLDENFPELSFIKSATVFDEGKVEL